MDTKTIITRITVKTTAGLTTKTAIMYETRKIKLHLDIKIVAIRLAKGAVK